MINLYRNIPELDLHGIDREYARVLINDFIDDNYKIKEKRLRIIHGVGKGILKKETDKTLRMNKKVESFSLNNFNVGETLVILKVSN